ncbi:hypothetical protein [Desulfosporosinus nitroreducens]|uniref:Uncharacterized protein n=1 Tax=Desulfosporosinus nitroreducens TaxID=2018668 RepID=A0ABT8QL90_9FIRM|nr:hypothetical protein [Desulfosporosinus nitroreducens]MDO0821890.1 hypothetical protein [Desulfosporosinus nitroreducens]
MGEGTFHVRPSMQVGGPYLVALSCLRKDVADVSHCVPGLGTGETLVWKKAHFMCAFYASLGSCSRLRREVGLGSQAPVDVCFGDSKP